MSVVAAFVVRRLMHSQTGAGWLFYATIPMRVLALLGGAMALLVIAPPHKEWLLLSYAGGLVVAGGVHLVVALSVLRK